MTFVELRSQDYFIFNKGGINFFQNWILLELSCLLQLIVAKWIKVTIIRWHTHVAIPSVESFPFSLTIKINWFDFNLSCFKIWILPKLIIYLPGDNQGRDNLTVLDLPSIFAFDFFLKSTIIWWLIFLFIKSLIAGIQRV